MRRCRATRSRCADARRCETTRTQACLRAHQAFARVVLRHRVGARRGGQVAHLLQDVLAQDDAREVGVLDRRAAQAGRAEDSTREVGVYTARRAGASAGGPPERSGLGPRARAHPSGLRRRGCTAPGWRWSDPAARGATRNPVSAPRLRGNGGRVAAAAPPRRSSRPTGPGRGRAATRETRSGGAARRGGRLTAPNSVTPDRLLPEKFARLRLPFV